LKRLQPLTQEDWYVKGPTMPEYIRESYKKLRQATTNNLRLCEKASKKK